MGDMSHEPSMEEILSSIKKIIAEDGDKPASVPRLRRNAPRDAVAVAAPEAPTAEIEAMPLTSTHADTADILELTDDMNEPAMDENLRPAPAGQTAEISAPQPANDAILAEKSVTASRNALAQLTKAKAMPVATAASTTDNAIEALVIEALRPMLKEWLDANLPRVVEKMVAKEIARLRED